MVNEDIDIFVDISFNGTDATWSVNGVSGTGGVATIYFPVAGNNSVNLSVNWTGPDGEQENCSSG